MRTVSSSLFFRGSMILSLLGAALIVFGFFLPMFFQSNPQIPGSIHPVYEWQAVAGFGYSSTAWLVSLGIVAVLPILCGVVVFGANIVARLRMHSSALLSLRHIGAGTGLSIQLLLELFLFALSLIGYARTDIGWGFAVVPVGFLVLLVSTFLD